MFKIMTKISVIFRIKILFLLIASNIFSQSHKPLYFDRITAENGLPSTAVEVVYQDSDGFLWLGTENGLCLFDGYSFKVFQNDPNDPKTISDNWILSIAEDSDKNLWIGTHGGGINKFNKKEGTFINFKVNNDDFVSLKNNRVWTIFLDDDGSLFFGTSGGLNKFDSKRGQYVNYSNNPTDENSLSNNAVNKIFKDSKGNIWLGTFGGGLNRLIKSNGGYKFESFGSNPNLKFVGNSRIKAIAEDKFGILWLGTFNDGLIRFDYNNKTEFVYNKVNGLFTADRISSLTFDQKGDLFIGSNKNGVFVLNNSEFDKSDFKQYKFANYVYDYNNVNSINDNAILTIYKDNTGLLWFGTNRGLNRLNNLREKFSWFKNNPNVLNSLSDDIIKSVFQDSKGNIWVGTYNGGINKFNLQNGEFIAYKNNPVNQNSISDNSIWVIKEDKQGNIWCGTSYGLNKFDPISGKFKVYLKSFTNQTGLRHNNISALYFDNYDYLWIGTYGGGISIMDLKDERVSNYFYDKNDSTSLSNDQIKFIFEDSKNNIWIGTLGGGLNRLDRKKFNPGNKIEFNRYFNDNKLVRSLSNNSLTSIYEDKKSNIYIGTYGGGLNKFNLESIKDYSNIEFSKVMTKDGLPGNTIYGIMEDEENNLWISTNNGISKYNVAKNTFTNFNKNDGLQGNDFEQGYCKLNSGEMIFGGINGFNIFNPSEIKTNYNKPNIVLTSVKSMNKEIFSIADMFYKKDIEIATNSLIFSFEFAALDYVDATKINYKYKLEGFDSEWNEVGTKRYGSYTNLDAGKYTLKIMATNSSGIWNENEFSIKIVVISPFYKTLYAYFIYLVIILLLFFIWFRNAKKKKSLEIIKQQEEIERQKSTQEELEKSGRFCRTLYLISEAVNKENSMEDFFTQFHTIINELISTKNLFIALYNQVGGEIQFPYFADQNISEDFSKEELEQNVESIIYHLIKTENSQIISVEDYKKLVRNNEIKNTGWTAEELLGIVLKNSKGKTIGIMALQNYDKDEHFSDSIFDSLNLISAQIATAIEIKQAEDVRRKYDFIVNASGAFMTLISSSYIYEAANNAFCSSHKLTREEVVGKSISDIWGDVDFETKIRNYFNIALSGQEVNYQAWLETKNTGLMCYDITYYPYKDETGNFTHVVVVSRDITSLVKAEETVRKLLLAVEQTDELIFMTDVEGFITYTNPSFDKVYGYKKEEIIGKKSSILKSGMVEEEEYKKMWGLLVSGKSYKGELINKLKTGEFIEIENTINPFFDSYNNVLGFIAVQRDISERKKTEKALMDAKELAERSDRLKGEFLAQLSHEIRTPLNSIINSTELIQYEIAESANEDLNVLFDSVNKSAKRIIRTVHMIVNMSELQTNSYEYVPKYIELSSLVETVIKDYKNLVATKGIELYLHNNLANANIFGDEYSINQIITQIVDNAIKFTDVGIIEVVLDKNKFNELVLKVKDTGIGISQEYLPKLYQPFSQEEQGYTRRFDGNGLGLALTKKYCEINNAEIKCISNKGLGTEFIITFNNSKV